MASELLWCLGHHPKQDEWANSDNGQLIGIGDGTPAVIWAEVIEQLLDKNSHQSQMQTEPDDIQTPDHGVDSNKGKSLTEVIGECYRSVPSMTSPRVPIQHFRVS